MLKRALLAVTVSVALISATQPASADNPWPLIGGLVGGIIIGGAMSNNGHTHVPRYDDHFYYERGYGNRYRPSRRCLWRPEYDYHGNYMGDRLVCRRSYY